MADRIAHTLTNIAFGVAVAQVDRFARAGGRTRGGRRLTAGSAGERDFDGHGGVAAGVEDFEAADVGDRTHDCFR